jgi:hypothetical protein
MRSTAFGASLLSSSVSFSSLPFRSLLSRSHLLKHVYPQRFLHETFCGQSEQQTLGRPQTLQRELRIRIIAA